MLRPPVAPERLERRDGLVRITLKKAYTDGTIAVDMDPLSLLCRLATSVPPPRRHTIRYSGVLAPASPWRRDLAPMAACETPADGQRPRRPEGVPSYRPLGGTPGAHRRAIEELRRAVEEQRRATEELWRATPKSKEP